MSKSVAIITACGGSKRIPRKTSRISWGKPIIAYGIEEAIQSKLFADVMVSTDDHEIAKIAAQFGATVPFLRSQKASNDQATTDDVLNETFDMFKKMGKIFTIMRAASTPRQCFSIPICSRMHTGF
ncbi:MAG: hypothetical protein R2877_07895 [Bdellovibrionota bacterium]